MMTVDGYFMILNLFHKNVVLKHKLEFEPDNDTEFVIDYYEDRIFFRKNSRIIEVLEIGFNYRDSVLELSKHNMQKLISLKNLMKAETEKEREDAF